ncbi:tripartite tricarboxylate transporter permease [Cognatishimia sp. F0-27]|uniref:tripartite tricarboxylate transporter permease n=1 Tax=Cognatishimia sp. F0-27 TaxID=2816855 RepID=UPI001D0C810F|nr:tripartite tricarboxylate transporter permease [Cognatishimia sp. F0-27]MCC1494554.1 tripartite tricarboxylate transporter permease [Cognatishimia sp. F0-27]
MLEAAFEALSIISDPSRLIFVALGTVLGLMIGVIPGIGGLVGLALLLPFTFSMDPYTALAFLVGVQAVTTTSDTIPAVLFGVPGTTGSAATVLDGHPMAKNGQAGRAFGAAFTASVCGGLFGAVVLAMSIPLLRPFILSIGTPELLVICLLGMTLVVSLSHGALFKGLVAAALGLLLATIGDEAQTGTLRWTFGSFYLWDGLSLVPVALGLFAVPEMIDLGAAKRSIARDNKKISAWDQVEGMKDAFRNWWLVLRCSSIGTFLGSIPGLGANVIDWIAYGYAARAVPGAKDSFGKGDVRGVIASESANNAKEGGALVPTLAFGVPGSASMAILLGAFLIHGISPGPNMLDQDLDITFTLIWTVAIANILGAGICFLLAGQFAKVAAVRAGVLVPLVFGIMVIGAYQGARDYADLIVLISFGALGWAMKRLNWPRAPLILAFVLGGLVENYLFISQLRYGFEWMLQPLPAVVLLLIAFLLLRPLVVRFLPSWNRQQAKTPDAETPDARPPMHATRSEFIADMAMWAGVVALMIFVYVTASGWEMPARILPQTVAIGGFIAAGGFAVFFAMGKIPTMEVTDHEPIRAVLVQAVWMIALIVGVLIIGMVPAIAVFGFAYMLIEGKVKPLHAVLLMAPFLGGIYFLFHEMLHIPWPRSYLGDWLPDLRRATGRMI